MKKKYVKPLVEKIEFNYSVLATTSGCSTSGTTSNLLGSNCSQTGEWHTQG